MPSLLTVLKSLQNAGEPVSATVRAAPSSSVESAPISSWMRSAARTASVGSTSAPAWIITVWPSMPGCAGIAGPKADSSARMAFTSVMACWNLGSSTVSVSLWMTTAADCEESPPNCSSMMSRAASDSLPLTSHIAPDRAPSSFGANTPRPITSRPQMMNTWRRWLWDQRPSRASGVWSTGSSIIGRLLRGKRDGVG